MFNQTLMHRQINIHGAGFRQSVENDGVLQPGRWESFAFFEAKSLAVFFGAEQLIGWP